jgi:hypothetical protein
MPTTDPVYTWETLLAAVPAPTPEQTALYALTTPPADLIEAGAHIRTDKILTDLVRWGGQIAEFLPKATTAQRRRLLGFSEAFFRVTIHEGAKLRTMADSRSGKVDDREAERLALISAAAKAYGDGMDERDRLITALEGLRQYDSTLQERIDRARGRVADAASLERSIRALVKLAQTLLADSQSLLAQQLVDGGVTPQELADVEAAGEAAKTTDAAASGARAQGPVTQAELDQQDGVCLAHMGRLLRIFENAHEKDPSIPHLIPIATRRIFSPSRKRPAEPAEPTPTNEPK